LHLKSDELRTFRLTVLVQPVGEHQSRQVVSRCGADRPNERGFDAHGGTPQEQDCFDRRFTWPACVASLGCTTAGHPTERRVVSPPPPEPPALLKPPPPPAGIRPIPSAVWPSSSPP